MILCSSLLLACGDPSPNTDSTEPASPASDPAAAQPANPSEPATVADLFPEGHGRSLVLDTCGSCHAAACSAIGQRTAARWDSLKQDHREKVPNLSEEDLETTFAYLKEHFNDSKPEPSVPPQFLAGGCTPF